MSNGSEHIPERKWLQPGDRVRLTGRHWALLGLLDTTARVVDIDIDGDPLIEDPNGGVLAVYTNPAEGIDYSAERVEKLTSAGLERRPEADFDIATNRPLGPDDAVPLPTTSSIRHAYADLTHTRVAGDMFDRWLAGMIREAKAEARDEGRESVGLDMTKPLGSDGQRRATANPYREVS